MDQYVRRIWLQRCRDHASIPYYVIVDLRLDELFEFAPDPNKRNGHFWMALREKPHGSPQAVDP